MSRVHDRESGSLAKASAIGPALAPASAHPAPQATGGAAAAGDVLSGVLHTVQLTGALFFVVDASTPWVAGVPEVTPLTPILLPGAEHLISYHIVTRGPCWGALPDEPPVRLDAGDVLVIPHGDPYTLASAPGMRDESG